MPNSGLASAEHWNHTVILALVISTIFGCDVLWLDHAGLIALRNLNASRLLVMVNTEVWGCWVSLEQLQWRDWYNPPSELSAHSSYGAARERR